MGTVTLNNLWNFIQGLSLTSTDREWLANKLLEPTYQSQAISTTETKHYIISPKRKRLMGSVNIHTADIENDDKAQYILSK